MSLRGVRARAGDPPAVGETPALPKPALIKAHSFSQREILESIMRLHTGPIEADVTFGRGGLWRGLARPRLCFDLNPVAGGTPAAPVIPGDVRRLPVKSGSLASAVFDPPFMVTTGPGARIKDRFGTIGKNIEELWQFYFLALHELHRVIQPGGWLVVKCQDVVNSGRNHWSSCVLREQAESLGFRTVDRFVLLATMRLTPKTQQRQVHARKYHCFFWVFRKRRAGSKACTTAQARRLRHRAGKLGPLGGKHGAETLRKPH